MSKIGLLGDPAAGNPGFDKRIAGTGGLNNGADVSANTVLRRALTREAIACIDIDPCNSQVSDVSTLIIGDGAVFRHVDDPIYRAFRVRGRHILNTVAVSDAHDTAYLDDYLLVTVRSQADRDRLGRGEVFPCLELLRGDYLDETQEPSAFIAEISANALGVHVTPALRDCVIALVHAIYTTWDGPVVWMPDPLMDDPSLLNELAAAVPRSIVAPVLSGDNRYRAIGRLRALVTSSLRELCHAYSQHIGFACHGYSAAVGDFLRDRGLQAAQVRDADSIIARLGTLNSPGRHNPNVQRDHERCIELVQRIAALARTVVTGDVPTVERRPITLVAADAHALMIERERVNTAAIEAIRVTRRTLAIRANEAIIDQSRTLLSDSTAAMQTADVSSHFVKSELASVAAWREELNAKLHAQQGVVNELEQQLRRAERDRDNVNAQSRVAHESAQFDSDRLHHAVTDLRQELERQTQLAATVSEMRKRRQLRSRVAAIGAGAFAPLRRAMRSLLGRTHQHNLAFPFSVDSDLATPLTLGRGNALPINGWCFVPGSSIVSLSVIVGDQVIRVRDHSLPRHDVFTALFPTQDDSGASLLSGFQALIQLDPAQPLGRIPVKLRARIGNGDTLTMAIGELTTVGNDGIDPMRVEWADAGVRVAIAMTTCDPPMELFEAQIQSIIDQSHQNWICLIQDDGSSDTNFARIGEIVGRDTRFHLIRNQTRLGFYRNFEACLARIPEDAEFVALSDHDDRWYPDKLASLLAAFTDNIQLAYSDCRLVTPDGTVRSKTFWSTRRNNFTDLATMLVANTVTGAASLFRRDLLTCILPFPERLADAYHDHWIALCAMSRGDIAYVDHALYDYVQHANNVIGHHYREPPGIGALLRELTGAIGRPGKFTWTVSKLINDGTVDYALVRHKAMLATILLQRFPDLPARKRRVFERFRRFPDSLSALTREVIRARRAKRPTLKVEDQMLRGAIAMRIGSSAFRLRRPVLMRGRLEQVAPASKASAAPVAAAAPASERVDALRFGKVSWVSHNVSPLTLHISDKQPRRVNMLLATIDFRYVFGGYIGMFNLAMQFRRMGHRVRFVLTESVDYQPNEWRRQIRKFAGLETLFDEVEVASRYDRGDPLEVNAKDKFVATSCWTAHVAHKATRELGQDRFVFMVQEYEPIFSPHNSIHALFAEAYEFPHDALFSTELLQEYFRNHRIGVYARPDGDAHAAVFHNALQRFSPTRESMRHAEKRLLFYARPEDHAARNLFELGIMGLAELLRRRGVNASGWSFHGIGSIDQRYTIELAAGVDLLLVPRTTLDEYTALLPTFDVGLSLMLSPHPSLVPLEMAAAGMCAVTNTFENKTADALAAISSNLIAVPPTVQGIADGLHQAMLRSEDHVARLAGARVNWPSNWSDAFGDATLERLREFLDQ